MNLHEYQGKELLKQFGVKVQEGIVAETVEQAVEAWKIISARTGSEGVVVKAQVHAGGRGKGGGVKFAKNLEALKEKAGE
ncbi:MAG TPA: succinate--CoA ligase subunit beta, partial [Chitinophagales bacterium]|nr:succinate--CoA ligase subunit beta [Chitinophagales bacterium]